MKKLLKRSYFAFVLLFIYAPILAMVVFSFNNGDTTIKWTHASFSWYESFFKNSPFIKSIITSLFVAVISTIVSLVIGTLAAIGLSRVSRVTRNKWVSVANIPLINADVITAVSLMIVFLIMGLKFGLLTLIMAHISFNVPYVLVTIMPRLKKIDPSLIDASYDLGAKNHQVMFKVILPILKPAIITAAAIAFAMSFDDFIISYFTGGMQTNVSTFIYTAKKTRPFIFVFGTCLVLVIALSIITWNAINLIKQSRLETKQKLINNNYKLKTISKLNKQLDELNQILKTKTIIKKSHNLSLWIKYFILKTKLYFYKLKSLDKKISKLQWKQYKLKSKIQKEERYYSRLKKSEKKLKQLIKQFSSEKDVKKAAKLSLQIETLQEKVEFLKDQIEVIKEREQTANLKVKKLQNKIKLLKQDLSEEVNPSKKTINWYNKKIKYFEEWIIELEEGKDYYKLKLVVEKLKDLKNIKNNKISDLTDQLNELINRIYVPVLITKDIDLKIQNTTDIESLNNLNHKREVIIDKFTKLYNRKIDKTTLLIQKVNQKTDKLKTRLLPSSNENASHFKSFISRSWKAILITFIGIGAFSGLTAAYVLNNIYDLVVANWGEYIDPSLIGEFEQQASQKHNRRIRINYQIYNSNEILYNKLHTVDYDIMIPSDYMVQRLASENYLQKIDYSKLNIWGEFNEKNFNKDIKSKDFEKLQVNKSLLELMAKSPIHLEDETKEVITKNPNGTYLSTNSILDYSIPYLWGDLVIVVNPTQENIKFLEDNQIKFKNQKDDENNNENKVEIDNSSLSWDILWKAAAAGKKVALNNDPKNVFMLGSQKLYQKVNLTKKSEIDEVGKELSQLLSNSGVSLHSDDLISLVVREKFDFAVMYNGDAAYANYVHNEGDDDYEKAGNSINFIYGRPNKKNKKNNRHESTNVFSDNIVLYKDAQNLDLAYEFINFLYENSTKISDYVGVTSPLDSAIEEMTAAPKEGNKEDEGGTYQDFKNIYDPITHQNNGSKYETNNEQLSFTYNGKIDEYLVNSFNNLLANK
ncbi:ABC transporter, permease protein [synthetic Mycoplasma mycoides JCVI-syn1.0]|uniref:ABC transporter permease n=1 Tax=Mycoplasma mycoides subsp. capri TaxID=40477 RepID=A0AB38GDD9_MYCMC|nr:spermidine/putrescine ABC transporter permease/substrate-binding protein [Mycoplasma mycoides]ADH21732.1 ABC transporter, permease protein [synthetic Mycoplasma mycoides JCVI-syn1.0]AMW76367.1 Putative potCD or potHI [synthetic bacterium JCVI-Syn3.0]AMW76816.1 Putative potCD or potHI [synthetic bacterium JCVI-Syn2.0]AVX54653.1 Spermidine/putrescine ABC transporter permease [synthetic bacterium JCVI-Syn3A]QWN46344.1 extracellular solute-binding protein [synthetic bacterium JCVI-Syn3B]